MSGNRTTAAAVGGVVVVVVVVVVAAEVAAATTTTAGADAAAVIVDGAAVIVVAEVAVTTAAVKFNVTAYHLAGAPLKQRATQAKAARCRPAWPDQISAHRHQHRRFYPWPDWRRMTATNASPPEYRQSAGLI